MIKETLTFLSFAHPWLQVNSLREAPVVVETTSVTGLAVHTSGANIPKIQVKLPDGKIVWTRPAYVTARKVIK